MTCGTCSNRLNMARKLSATKCPFGLGGGGQIAISAMPIWIRIFLNWLPLTIMVILIHRNLPTTLSSWLAADLFHGYIWSRLDWYLSSQWLWLQYRSCFRDASPHKRVSLFQVDLCHFWAGEYGNMSYNRFYKVKGKTHENRLSPTFGQCPNVGLNFPNTIQHQK